MGIGQWLDAKPDTEPLKQVRQKIKTLKSKLRHKLADKQDAEEVSFVHYSWLGATLNSLKGPKYV